jgi:NAD-reducing hydrogenase large subunit
VVLHEVPYLKDRSGPMTGWYRVGPLARMNTASFIDTPAGEAHGRR